MAVEAEDLAARLKAEFPHALRTGQLVTYYQPEIELSSGRLVAAESLVRWEHPEFGTGGGCWRLYEDTEQAADPALA